jgi:glutaredoxin-related protein
MSLIEIKSSASLAKHTEETTKSVLLFGADWHEACPMLKMVLGALAAAPDNSGIIFGHVDAESVSDLTDKFDVTMVPTILLLVGSNGSYTVKERLEGEVLSDPSHVTLAVQRLANLQVAKDGSSGIAATATADNNNNNNNDASDKGEGDNTTNNNTNNNEDTYDPKKAALNDRLERLIRADAIMLFMKGTPDEPKCGFSRQAIDVFRKEEIPFGSFDILSDNDVRQGLKVYSDWPTYPQIVSYFDV